MKNRGRLGKKLAHFDRKDRQDQEWGLGRLNFTDYTADPALENEYFGGFRSSAGEDRANDRSNPYRLGSALHRSSGGVLSRRGRGPMGWAHDPWAYGLADGQTPELRSFLKKHGRWPKYRDRLAIWEQKRPRRLSNHIAFPFALQAIGQAEQKLPAVDPERDRAEELDRRERRPADPPFTPQRILHEERAHFYALHTQRRIQKVLYRGYKPSKKLELKRIGSLKRVELSPLLTNAYLAHTSAETKNEHRALLARLRLDVSTPLGAAVPAEKTAAQLKPKKMGRPMIGDHAMTAAERKRRSRANQKSKTLPAQERHPPGAAVPTPHRPVVPGSIHMDEREMKLLLEFAAGQAEVMAKLHEVLANSIA